MQATGVYSIGKQFEGDLPFIGGSKDPVNMQTQEGKLGVRCVHTVHKPSPHLTSSHIESAAHVIYGAKGVEQLFQENPHYRNRLQAIHIAVTAALVEADRVEVSHGISTVVFDGGETYQMLQREGPGLVTDRIVTKLALKEAIKPTDGAQVALIQFVGEDRTIQNWPYLTNEAVAYLIECGIRIVGLNIPSIDRESDGGNASNHKIVFADQNRLVVESLALDAVPTGKMAIELRPDAFGEDPDVVRCNPVLYN